MGLTIFWRIAQLWCPLAKVIDYLTQKAKNPSRSRAMPNYFNIDRSNSISKVCELLQEFELLEPFNIEIQKDKNSKVNLDGMFRISSLCLTILRKINSIHFENTMPLNLFTDIFIMTCVSKLVNGSEPFTKLVQV